MAPKGGFAVVAVWFSRWATFSVIVLGPTFLGVINMTDSATGLQMHCPGADGGSSQNAASLSTVGDTSGQT